MLKAIKLELIKGFTGMKTYIPGSVLLLLSFLIPIGIYIARTQGIDIQLNGQSLPLMLLSSIGKDVLPILIIIATAGMIADELRDGTLKQLLVRPITRSQLIFGKMVMILANTVFFLSVTLFGGYIAGTVVFGWGEGLIVQTGLLGAVQGIGHTLGVYALTVFPMLGYGLIVLLLSQIFISSGAVIGISLGLYFGMQIAANFMKDIRFLILTEYFNVGFILIDGFSWQSLLTVLGISGAYIAIFGVLSLAVMRSRDILY